jgi:hypothetical protein
LATGHRDALLLNVHFHTLVPDGVFALEGDGPARFVRLPAPRDEDVDAILRRIVRSAAKALVGYDEMESELDALVALQAAEAERRARFPDPFKHARLSAFLDGFSLHAGVRIHGNDRVGLERLCGHVLRPPFALQRLSKGEDGRLVYRMKRPRGGSLFLVLTPDELLARLATLVPPPRVYGVRYHGAFAPHSKARRYVVPAAGESRSTPDPSRVATRQATRKRSRTEGMETARTYRVPWAELLRKVFEIDVLACPQCGGRLQLIAFIAEPTVVKRILDHLGVNSTGPPLALPLNGEADAIDPAPAYDVADPVYEG